MLRAEGFRDFRFQSFTLVIEALRAGIADLGCVR